MQGTSPYFRRLLGTFSGGTLTGVTTGTSIPINVSSFNNVTFYIQAIGNPGAGTIVFETAAWEPNVQPVYTGTWSPIQTIDASALVTDAQLNVSAIGNCYQWIRVRISVDITVATIVVYVVGSGN